MTDFGFPEFAVHACVQVGFPEFAVVLTNKQMQD